MTPLMTRRETLAVLAVALSPSAHAQTWPSKPITMIVPYPAGGGTDAVARLIAEKIGAKLGQTIVVDNKAGASGLLGTGAVAKAAPDGYTILVALSTQFVINPFLFKKLPYDPNKDIALVSQIVVAPIVLLAHPLIGGQVPMGFGSVTQAKAMIDGGKLKAIGVTGDKRLGVLPKVPTFTEQGIKDDVFRTVGWIAMAAPGATPKAVIQRLADEVKAACALPDVRERMAGFGFEAVGRGPDEFAAIAKADAQVWSRLVKQTGATLD